VAGHYPEGAASSVAAGRTPPPRVCILVSRGDREAGSCRQAAAELTSAGYVADLRVFESGDPYYPSDRVGEQVRAVQFVLSQSASP
jgi:hypothetical protein